MEDREQDRASDELRLPEDRVEDLEPDEAESANVAGGASKAGKIEMENTKIGEMKT
jgi:hypothetical protein